jgi:predicted aldo/keto reductase-like oxidoreductase
MAGKTGRKQQMVYREFGRTGVRVPRLGFGAMRLPINKDDDGKITGIEESAEIVRHAIDKGIDYIDSAPYYCHHESEVAVGRAIQGYPRDELRVSTKNPLKNACGDCWRLRLELSLRKLQTTYIDFYHFWGLTWQAYLARVTNENGPLAAARKAKDEGLIKHVSFSSHDKPEGVHKLIDTGEFETMLVQYNLLDRQYEECLAHAHEAGLGTAVMGSVGGGRLGARSGVISSATGCSSTAETALRFVFANPNLDMALSGMGTKQMVDENIATAEREEYLTPEELARIDALAEENKKLLDLPCTGCGYCTPCPHAVAIPDIFQMYQWHEAFDLKESARGLYKGLGTGWQKKKKPVTECVECGECEEKCPQKIAIMEKLKEAHAVLSGESTERAE